MDLMLLLQVVLIKRENK